MRTIRFRGTLAPDGGVNDSAGGTGSTEIADGAITTAKIADEAVTGDKLANDISIDGVVDDTTIEINGGAYRVKDGGITTAKVADAAITPAKTNIVEARTATDDGTTTGTISANKRHIVVTSAASSKQVILPAPVQGISLVIDVGANGFDLKSSTPASIAINGGTGESAKSAIPANSTVFLTCVSSTAWKGFYMDADGDVAKVPAAA